MCGSCAMMVNGVPRWTCRTHISTIAPLRNLPVIKDLVVDMDPFFDKWIAAEGVHHGRLSRHDSIPAVDETTNERTEANDAIECINCAVCYAACDTVASDDAVSGDGGCVSCHSMGSCTAYCPVELNPMLAIAKLKRVTTKRFFGGKQ